MISGFDNSKATHQHVFDIPNVLSNAQISVNNIKQLIDNESLEHFTNEQFEELKQISNFVQNLIENSFINLINVFVENYEHYNKLITSSEFITQKASPLLAVIDQLYEDGENIQKSINKKKNVLSRLDGNIENYVPSGIGDEMLKLIVSLNIINRLVKESLNAMDESNHVYFGMGIV